MMRYRWNESGDAIEEFEGEDGAPTQRTIPKAGPLFKALTEPTGYPEVVDIDPETHERTVIPAEPAPDPIVIEPYKAPPAAASAAPTAVQASALRIALRRADLFDLVNEAIATSGDAELQDRWEYSTEYSADSPVLIFVAETLGLGPDEIAALLRQAGEVVV